MEEGGRLRGREMAIRLCRAWRAGASSESEKEMGAGGQGKRTLAMARVMHDRYIFSLLRYVERMVL